MSYYRNSEERILN